MDPTAATIWGGGDLVVGIESCGANPTAATIWGVVVDGDRTYYSVYKICCNNPIL